MEWLQAALGIAAAVASWRWLIRPLRRAYAELVTLLRQIRDNAGGMARLTAELHALAGSMTQFANATRGKVDDHDDQLEALSARMDSIAELVVDALADVARLRRKVNGDDETTGDDAGRADRRVDD